MAPSDPDATRDDDAVRISPQLPMSDLPTATAPSTPSTDKSAGQPVNQSEGGSADETLLATAGSTARVADSTQPNSTSERYVRRSSVGNGGFSIVYEAWDTQLHRLVAIKVNRLGLATDPESYRRFVEEARAVAKLNHPNIVKVFDVGTDKDLVPYVVLEFIDGGSLAQRIKTDAKPDEKSTPLSHNAVISTMISVADAVHAAHRAGLVHRDLKPANILLDRNDQPHVTDFGLAVDDQSQRQQRGSVSGTWFYMSPEQIRGEVQYLDGRTDIWSLGVILYELLASRRPFWGKTPAEVQDEILNREPKPLRQIDDSIPLALEQICFRCMSKQIKDRYSSAADVANALRACQTKSIWQFKLSIAMGASVLVGFLLILGYAAYISRPTPLTEYKQPASGSVNEHAIAASEREIFTRLEQKADPDPAAIAEKPEIEAMPPVLVPKIGKWFSLLRQRPQVLVWPDDGRNSHWEYFPDEEKLLLSSDKRAMLKLGETESRDYKIELNILQPPWTGNTGIFFGGRSIQFRGVSCRQFQLIQLKIDNNKQRNVLLQRWRIILNNQSEILENQNFISAFIPPLTLREQVLRIGVENGRLSRVEWNQTLLQELTDPGVGLQLGEDDCAGAFGVYVNGATTVFRRPELLLNQEKVNE